MRRHSPLEIRPRVRARSVGHLRGTGESFAANIGGRLIGTCFAWVTANLAITSDPNFAPIKLAYTAAAIGFAVYRGGFFLSFFLPEPKSEDLKE